MSVAVKPCKLGGEITSAREDTIMVANHPGMTDQTSSNIARDGAPKRVQSKVADTHGMTDQTDASKLKGISPDSPGFGDASDASGPNVLDPAKGIRNKSGPIPVKWGMKGNHDPASGTAVLSEAANLGR